MRCFPLLAIALSLPIAPVAGFSQAGPPEPADLAPDEWERVRQGDILIWTDIGLKYGEVVAMVDGPIGDVASILFDWESTPKWLPAQSKARVLERREVPNAVHKVVYAESRMPFPFARRKWRADVVTGEGVDEDGRAIAHLSWQYIPDSGNIKASTGFWYLSSGDEENRTLVHYVAYADLGIWLPDFIIDWATKDILPRIMKGLRERYEEVY